MTAVKHPSSTGQVTGADAALSKLEGLLECVAAPWGSAVPPARLLLVFAHPDDEVLAMGARLERLAASHLLTFTDGAPADGADARHHGYTSLAAYRDARAQELAAALAHAGLSAQTLVPSQSLGLLPVPDQTAALHLAELSRALVGAIRTLAPEAVLTHPYEGGHPDHDACAFAVHTAVRLIQASQPATPGQAPVPAVLEAPFYHAGENGTMRTGEFLPAATASIVRHLSPEEQANKGTRLACFRSQAETLAQFPLTQEAFRIAPVYDFTAPPHPGQLFYEHFPWGITGERFRELARDALRDLLGPAMPDGASGMPVERTSA